LNKRYFFDSLFEGNPLVLLCVLFTLNILTGAIFSAITGLQFTLSSRGIFVQLLYSSPPVIAIAVPAFFHKRKIIDESSYYFWTGIPMHYITSGLLLSVYVFFVRLIFPPPPEITAFQVHAQMILNFTIGYIFIVLGAIVICLIQIALANRALKQIQQSQKN